MTKLIIICLTVVIVAAIVGTTVENCYCCKHKHIDEEDY